MIREEINEIKKQFNKDTNVITKYAGCYVDAEKNIKFMTIFLKIEKKLLLRKFLTYYAEVILIKIVPENQVTNDETTRTTFNNLSPFTSWSEAFKGSIKQGIWD